MIKASVVIFSLAGLVGITLAAIGLKFLISFIGGVSVMFLGILIEGTVIGIKRKKDAKEKRDMKEKASLSLNY